jgi:hypothetical protein
MKFKHEHIAVSARSRPRSGFPSWMLLVILVLTGFALTTTAKDEATPQPKEGVKMIIDYGDGVQKHFTVLSWKKGMTGLDALNQAKQHPRGIRFNYRGKGARGFLTAIDGLKNEGSGKNWIYRVNGKLGDRSFAIQPLNRGDVTLWKFGQYK